MEASLSPSPHFSGDQLAIGSVRTKKDDSHSREKQHGMFPKKTDMGCQSTLPNS